MLHLICADGYSVFASGMSNGMVSAAKSLLRTFVLQVAAMLCLPLLFGLNGIWCAVPVAEIGTLIASVALVLGYRKRYGYL